MKTLFVTLILVATFGVSWLLEMRVKRSELRGRTETSKESLSERKISPRILRNLPPSRRSVYRDLSQYREEGAGEALEYFRDWSGDELKALVLQMRDQMSEKDTHFPDGFSKTAEVVFLLVSELDPKWLLENVMSLQFDRRIESYFSEWWIMGMSALVERDVQEARKMFSVATSSLKDPTKRFSSPLDKSHSLILGGLFASDPKKALEFQKHYAEQIWGLPDRSLMRLKSPDVIARYGELIREIPNRRDRDQWVDILTAEVWRLEGLGAALQFHKRQDSEESIWGTFIETINQIPEHRMDEELGEEILSYFKKAGLADHEQMSCVSDFVSKWAWRDFEAAGKWALKLKDGLARDYTMLSLARSVIKTDPEAARFWAEKISDLKLRNEVLETSPK